ncbi:MAG: hypothetical protein NT023_16295 [Armatimonadetes bacterium]|nr:hypothetical protein [Armatimonadota bacterium]
MQRFLTPAQRVSHALRRAETQLRNWQDDPDSPRQDVDKMIIVVAELRQWVSGHIVAELEREEENLKNPSFDPPV